MASAQIGDQLRAVGEWTAHEDTTRSDSDGGGTYYRNDDFELRTFDTIHVELGDPAPAFSESPALLIFVSRHAGETGQLLTAHFTGNFGAAEYGGDAGSFARAAPGAQKAVVAELNRHAPEAYEVGIECTHHGPTACDVPSLFVELGSSETQWEDTEAARAIAESVLELGGVTAEYAPDERGEPRHVVGFGGGHYTPRGYRIVADTEWAVGHIGSEWQLEAMGAPEENRRVIEAAFEASAARLAVVDGEYPALERVIDNLGYRVVSETWLRTVGRRPLTVVDAAEATLSSVAEGLRFGAVSIDSKQPAEAWHVVSLPDELIAATTEIDTDATRAAVAEATVAYETTEGATLPAGRALVAEPTAVAQLVDRLTELLDEAYETVAQTAEGVVCRETGFDPEKAATLGVPEGPKFGRLADGEAVTVNGREITPAAVESERVDRFPVEWPAEVEKSETASDGRLTNGER